MEKDINNSEKPNLSNVQELNPLGKLVSIIILLSAALYFTGWTYRWSYFSLFHIQVTSLNLPLESFYIAAFQVFFGDPLAICKTAIVFVLSVIVILTTLHITHNFSNKYLRRFILSNFRVQSLDSLNFLGSLVDEFIIVLWCLAILFWLAQWQGNTDAWRDAVHETSALPIVTVVIPEEIASIGRQLNKPLVNPSNLRIIGDQSLYKRLLGKELSDTSNSKKARVWRLLIDQDGYFYIFPALPKKNKSLGIPVVIIYESANGNQLTILRARTIND